MTKIDIVSGFLGAGKTTLIKKLLKEAFASEQVVLIENEFGEIGIDGGFLKDAGVEITEMNSGCICCSLVGDFGAALKEVLSKYHPDRVIIEPSGVGKLSDVMKAVEDAVRDEEVLLNSAVAVVDAKKCKTYLKNFGEFFENQIRYAGTIILSRTGDIKEDKLNQCISLVREHNAKAAIITTAWEMLSGEKMLETIENAKDLESELMADLMKMKEHDHEHGEECSCGCHDHDHEHAHHHHDHDHEHHHDHEHAHHEHGEECSCGCHDHDHEHAHHHHDYEHAHHHHDHDHEHHHDHEHAHHEHGDECSCGCHDHDHEHHHDHEHAHHEHGEECSCGCHDHDHDHDHDHAHHHHHHADEVFTSWGMETPDKYSMDELHAILDALADKDKYGYVLRAKGMLPGEGSSFIHFDYVPNESDVREGSAEYTGRICVIGSNLNEDNLKALFTK